MEECRYCGTLFDPTDNTAGPQEFCSHQCLEDCWWGEDNPEIFDDEEDDLWT